MLPGEGFTLWGEIAPGLGEGKFFTQIPWAREQFVAKLGIDPFPGTLNLTLNDEEMLSRARWLRGEEVGILVSDPLREACDARCFPVDFGQGVRGAIVLPAVDGYPLEKLEIIAAVNLKHALGLEDGATVEITVPWSWPGLPGF